MSNQNSNKRCKTLLYLSFFVTILAACSEGSTKSEPQQDSVGFGPTAADSIWVVHSNESIKNMEYAMEKQIDYFQPDNRDQVEAVAPFFTPKEVYIEILRRTGDLSKDTLPFEVLENYTPQELTRILEKNKALERLSGRDILALYKYIFPPAALGIIGQDDRYSVVYDPMRPEVRSPLTSPEMECAKSVMAIIPRDSLKLNADGNYEYVCSITFGQRYELCGEVFSSEPSFSEGTGVVIDSVTMLTAFHCVDTVNLHNYYFVFDYILDSNKYFHRIIDPSKVYEAKSVKGDLKFIDQIDYSIVTLNKPVPKFRLANLQSTGATGAGRSYYVIGTPGGLPLKVSPNAAVKTNNLPECFTILSDTYRGNSGSPVFNTDTHRIEGIFVGGAEDFAFKEIPGVPCQFSVVCPYVCRDAPDGERVSRISQFLTHLVKLP